MKQVLLVNSALALPPGKMAAQVAHASIAAFLVATNANRQKWLDVGMPKIVLDGQNEAQLDMMLRRALEADVPAYLVRDAGRTVIAAGTVTCLGLGPACLNLRCHVLRRTFRSGARTNSFHVRAALPGLRERQELQRISDENAFASADD